jgi:hypothetical protein
MHLWQFYVTGIEISRRKEEQVSRILRIGVKMTTMTIETFQG